MKTFTEIQRFNQPWLKVLLLIVLLPVFLPVILNWQDKEALESITWIAVGTATFSFLLMYFLIFVLRLKTVIDSKGIHYQFIPFMRSPKSYFWRDIRECYVTKYNPLRDFGGWGYRMSFKKGKAVNIRGNMGIQLILNDGKKVLIGTQKTNEAETAITHFYKG